MQMPAISAKTVEAAAQPRLPGIPSPPRCRPSALVTLCRLSRLKARVRKFGLDVEAAGDVIHLQGRNSYFAVKLWLSGEMAWTSASSANEAGDGILWLSATQPGRSSFSNLLLSFSLPPQDSSIRIPS